MAAVYHLNRFKLDTNRFNRLCEPVQAKGSFVMSTAILTSAGPVEDRLAHLLQSFRAAWQAHRRAAADRRALARAGRLGPRLLADMGRVTEARSRVGDWETLLPNGYLVRPVR